MVHKIEELLRLFIDYTDHGMALIDDRANLLISNPLFDQLCSKFSNKIRDGDYAPPIHC